MNGCLIITAICAVVVGCLILVRRKCSFKSVILKNSPVKGVVLVRTDLKMKKGKMVSQAMHGAYAAGIDAQNNAMNRVWSRYGFKKVALQVTSEEEMKEITKILQKQKVSVYPIVDAGRTQVEPNTWTVTFIGPDYEEKLDKVTGHLKLL
ncbi:peptidyl-tRNA hydrolase, PTH2 family [Nematocida sp. LUAm3]|nr:peptidyl-tRNA hydrolase, PTH2 family [Nematocida sp. LUAm3]KAI5173719.1 peptidyl-tRNA hydrolase, PTH2 family [Nematocida sp. LUAm2]KAI5176941.1 peptidyl-tRNA hydrolase, PTH2 family [Nematocida sp. LUAm1]